MPANKDYICLKKAKHLLLSPGNSMNKNTLAIKIKQARIESGIKQEISANELNIAVSAISAIESGNRKIDAIELWKLAKLYSKKIGWFFDESDKPEFEYKDDKLMHEAFTLMENSPKNFKRAALKGLIGFLKEGNTP